MRHFRRFLIKSFCVAVLLGFGVQVEAKVIYQQGNNAANYVKLIKMKEKVAEDRVSTHPATVSIEQMEAFLASLRYNKAMLFREEMKDRRIFNDEEAKKFAPYLVEALAEADPFEQVAFSIVTKRPYFIIRNDAVNQGLMWVHKNELHVKFTKLAAKLTGDYKMRGSGDRIVQQSRGVRVSLDTIQGQKLSFEDGSEIIIEMNADWPTILAQVQAQDDAEKKTKSSLKIFQKNKDKVAQVDTKNPVITSPSAGGSVEARLKTLKELKDKGLISPQDYELKKKEILKNL